LYEAPTITADGGDTNVIVSNYNRNSSNTLSATIKSSPTVTDDGTELLHRLFSSEQQVAGDSTFQLKYDTDYVVKITNLFGDDIDFSANIVLFDI
jgi:hypothetical protein